MKIITKKKKEKRAKVQFKDIIDGDVFMFNHKIYIKCNINMYCNCININYWEGQHLINGYELVEIVDTELHIFT